MKSNEITSRQFEIIEAAGKILTNSGVGGLTIKKLAAEMGFSEAALYRHFKSKEDILVVMLSFLANSMESRFSAIGNDIQGTDRLKAIFQTQIDFFTQNPHFVVVVFANGLFEENERINKHIDQIMKVKRKHLLPLIKQCQRDGIFKEAVSAEETVHIIMGSFRLKMYKWHISKFDQDLNKVGNQLIDSLITILKKD